MHGKIAVNGVSGAQGRAIAARLGALGHDVVGISRSDASVSNDNSLDFRLGDFDDDSFAVALNGVESLVLTYPVAFDVSQASKRIQALLAACAQNRVEHVIFNSSIPLADYQTGVKAIDIKRHIADQLRQSRLKISIVEPTIYLDNLLAPWSIGAIRDTQTIVYPLPAETLVSWTSWEDVAEAVHCFRSGESATDTIKLAQRPSMTGTDLAGQFSEVRQAEHRYFSLPIPDFKTGLAAAMGDEVASELGRLYEWLATDGSSSLCRHTAHGSMALEPVTAWISQQNWS
jgi:NAD(P)H dehydrogenase (quinone)